MNEETEQYIKELQAEITKLYLRIEDLLDKNDELEKKLLASK